MHTRVPFYIVAKKYRYNFESNTQNVYTIKKTKKSVENIPIYG